MENRGVGQNGLSDLIDRLWVDYSSLNPQASKIHSLLESRGEQILNDHIALRTFNDPRIGISALAQVFENHGYQEKGDYHFREKKLYAKHFEHFDLNLPKIFISELLVEEFPESFQTQVRALIQQFVNSSDSKNELCTLGTVWKSSYQDYEKLREFSEYAAWMAAFGFRANHFTVNVNALKSFSSLGELNEFLKNNGFKLNPSGGEIKGSPEVYLEQSSTLADQVEVEFTDGKYVVPCCYYEFAKRYPLPSGALYQGFVAQSADKIFESTDKGKA